MGNLLHRLQCEAKSSWLPPGAWLQYMSYKFVAKMACVIVDIYHVQMLISQQVFPVLIS